jgi:hypothetical protein
MSQGTGIPQSVQWWARDWTAKEPGFDSWEEEGSFFSAVSLPALGLIQPPSQWVLSALSPGVQQQGQQGHEANHSLPSRASPLHQSPVQRHVLMFSSGYLSRYSYGLDGPGSIPGSVRFFSLPQRQDRVWGPPSLLCGWYRELFPRGKAVGSWSWPHTSIQCQDQEWWSYAFTPWQGA